MEVNISLERYEQLVKAESDAERLKALIEDRYEHYRVIDRDELKVLKELFCGKKEGE